MKKLLLTLLLLSITMLFIGCSGSFEMDSGDVKTAIEIGESIWDTTKTFGKIFLLSNKYDNYTGYNKSYEEIQELIQVIEKDNENLSGDNKIKFIVEPNANGDDTLHTDKKYYVTYKYNDKGDVSQLIVREMTAKDEEAYQKQLEIERQEQEEKAKKDLEKQIRDEYEEKLQKEVEERYNSLNNL